MPGLVMGFDFGTSRIGVAVGQQVTATANPVATVSARDGIPDWIAMYRLIAEWQPEQFVVGLPLNMDDTTSEMAGRARKFARRLNGRYNIPADMMDERLSTFEAKEITDDDVDAVAACLILETWLTSAG